MLRRVLGSDVVENEVTPKPGLVTAIVGLRARGRKLVWPVLQLLWAGVRFCLPDGLFVVVLYLRKHGRLPRLLHPEVYTEKVLCKMLFDRSEVLPVIADKLAVRDFVAERVGSAVLTEIYGVYDSASEIRFDALPEKFVLKATHGAGFNYFAETAIDRDPDAIVSKARKWLATDFGGPRGEWCYTPIRRRLYAEEYFDFEGSDSVEYKFYCFDGELKYIKVLIGHKGYHALSRFFDLDWNTLEVAENQPNFPPDRVPRPETLEAMLEISRLLSAGFDSLRVDLYSIRGRIIFGELTVYPNAGNHRFQPIEYDRKFGAYWSRESMTYLPATVGQVLRRLLR